MNFRLPKWLKTISLIGLAFLLIYFAFKKVNVFEVWGYAKKHHGYTSLSVLP